MAKTKDYYKVLGLERGAGEQDIRSAYRKLARQYHPDVNKDPDAAKRFHEISEAYEVLSDPEKRAAYDRFGHASVGVGGPGGARPGPGGGEWTTDFSTGHVGDFSDILEQMFGGGGSPFGQPWARPRPAARPGRDLPYAVTITFLTAVRGGTEEVRLRREDGSTERISVRIPPGIESGAKLRVRGKGQPGQAGGRAGDLIVTVTVGEHPYFSRDGLDLLVTLPLTLSEAALGTTVSVPLLSGSVELKVPPGSSSGTKLRVKGQGITDAGGRSGDFFAVVQIVAPRKLTPKARELLEKLSGELQNPRDSGPWGRQ